MKLRSKFVERRRGVQKRDNASLRELKIIDLPYALGIILTFDERYSVKQNSINSLLHNMNKLPQVSSQSIDEPEVPQ